jgi:hypothetical protein
VKGKKRGCRKGSPNILHLIKKAVYTSSDETNMQYVPFSSNKTEYIQARSKLAYILPYMRILSLAKRWKYIPDEGGICYPRQV